VRRLREKISDLKIQISTITKGIPMSKIELRDDNKKSNAAQKTTSDSGATHPASSASSSTKHSTAALTGGATTPQKPSAAFVKSQQAHATAILNQQNAIATG
jgi:hypothetical protein